QNPSGPAVVLASRVATAASGSGPRRAGPGRLTGPGRVRAGPGRLTGPGPCTPSDEPQEASSTGPTSSAACGQAPSASTASRVRTRPSMAAEAATRTAVSASVSIDLSAPYTPREYTRTVSTTISTALDCCDDQRGPSRAAG